MSAIYPAHLRALAYFMAKDGIGCNLDAICVDMTKCATRLVAWNGPAMGVIETTQLNATTGRVIVPAHIVLSACRADIERVQLLDRGAGWWEFIGTVMPLRFVSRSGGYPDHRAFLPTMPLSGEAASYDPDELILFSKAGRALGLRKQVPAIWQNGAGPALVQFHDLAHEFAGVIQPHQHHKARQLTPPLWLGRTQP